MHVYFMNTKVPTNEYSTRVYVFSIDEERQKLH